MSKAVCALDPPTTSSHVLSPNILQFPSLLFLPFPSFLSLCLFLFTLLMLVEGFRANAVNVIGFKALQMPVCLFQSATAKSVSFRFEDRFLFHSSQISRPHRTTVNNDPVRDSKPQRSPPHPSKLNLCNYKVIFSPRIDQ